MVNVIINGESKIASNHKWEVDKQEFKEIKAMLGSRYSWIRASAFLYLNSDAEYYFREFNSKETSELKKLNCHYNKDNIEWYEFTEEPKK